MGNYLQNSLDPSLLFLLVSIVTSPKQDTYSDNKTKVEVWQPRIHRQKKGKRGRPTPSDCRPRVAVLTDRQLFVFVFEIQVTLLLV